MEDAALYCEVFFFTFSISHFTAWSLKMVPKYCAENSVTNCQSRLRIILERDRSGVRPYVSTFKRNVLKCVNSIGLLSPHSIFCRKSAIYSTVNFVMFVTESYVIRNLKICRIIFFFHQGVKMCDFWNT